MSRQALPEDFPRAPALTLARELIQMRGGSLTMESAPGQRLAATVWLPAGAAALALALA